MTTQVEERPKCPKCGCGNGYIRLKTGEYVCRECGMISTLDKSSKASKNAD